MQSQTTSNILMIRPVNFAFNEQTAESNAFQDVKSKSWTNSVTQQDALQEFDAMVSQLRTAGVNVIVYDDTPEPHKPDSIFPNNWISFHHSGKVCLYPMQAENRRLERRNDIIDANRAASRLYAWSCPRQSGRFYGARQHRWTARTRLARRLE